MRFRNYIIQMADRSAFYVTERDGVEAMKSYARGQAVIVRGRMVAHHMISVIRPCNAIEAQEAAETIHNEERAAKFRDGSLKIEERKVNGQLQISVVPSTPRIDAPM